MNHTITLYDGAQKALSAQNTTVTWDGENTFAMNTSLPYPVTFTQLGVTDGLDWPNQSYKMENLNPVLMEYGGDEWRNDDLGHCKFGLWDNYETRDFDCGFSCPGPGEEEGEDGDGDEDKDGGAEEGLLVQEL